MSDQPPTEQPGDDFPHYVLRMGQILGPFTLGDMRELVTENNLSYDDFVQRAGTAEWLPLRWLLIPDKAGMLEGAIAPGWRTLLQWSWMRLCHNLGTQSMPAGLACIGIATIGCLLSRWPLVFWAPWAVLAFLAGIALLRRNREGQGITLMLASAVVPFGIWVLLRAAGI